MRSRGNNVVRRKKRAQPGYWLSLANQRSFFDNFAKTKRIKNPNDWYSVSLKELLEKKGSFIFKYYNGSLFKALKTNYPEYSWNYFKQKTIPTRFWKDEENQKEFLNYVASALKITKLYQWKKITNAQLISLGGKPLLSRYKSLNDCLSHLYPDWGPKKKKVFYTKEKQYQLMERIRKRLGFKNNYAYWRSVKKRLFLQNGGKYLLDQYGGNFEKIITTTYPHFLDLRSHFTYEQQFFSKENRKVSFKEIGEKLGIVQLEDWYSTSYQSIRAIRGGKELLQYYSNSLYDLLCDLKPTFPWEKFRLQQSNEVWRSFSAQREFLDQIIYPQLQFSNLDNWYHVDLNILFLETKYLHILRKLMHFYKLDNLFDRNSTFLIIISMLKSLYPNYPWDFEAHSDALYKTALYSHTVAKSILLRVQRMYLIDRPSDWHNLCKYNLVINHETGKSLCFKPLIHLLYKEYPLKQRIIANQHLKLFHHSASFCSSPSSICRFNPTFWIYKSLKRIYCSFCILLFPSKFALLPPPFNHHHNNNIIRSLDSELQMRMMNNNNNTNNNNNNNNTNNINNNNFFVFIPELNVAIRHCNTEQSRSDDKNGNIGLIEDYDHFSSWKFDVSVVDESTRIRMITIYDWDLSICSLKHILHSSNAFGEL